MGTMDVKHVGGVVFFIFYFIFFTSIPLYLLFVLLMVDSSVLLSEFGKLPLLTS